MDFYQSSLLLLKLLQFPIPFNAYIMWLKFKFKRWTAFTSSNDMEYHNINIMQCKYDVTHESIMSSNNFLLISS